MAFFRLKHFLIVLKTLFAFFLIPLGLAGCSGNLAKPTVVEVKVSPKPLTLKYLLAATTVNEKSLYGTTAISPDDHLLVTTNGVNFVVREITGGKTVLDYSDEINQFGNIYGLAFSPDSKTMAVAAMGSGEGGIVEVWNTNNWSISKTINLQRSWAYENLPLWFSEDGKTLKGIYHTFQDNAFVLELNIDNEKITNPGKNQIKTITPLAINKHGDTLFGSGDAQDPNPYGLFSLISGQKLLNLKTTNATAASFSRDGRLLAIGDERGQIGLYQTVDGRQIAKFPLQQGEISTLTFSTNQDILFSGSANGTLKAWDIAKQHEVFSSSPQQANLTNLALSEDGKVLISNYEDGAIRVWDVD